MLEYKPKWFMNFIKFAAHCFWCIYPFVFCTGVRELTKLTTGKLNNGLPQVPPPKSPASEELLSLPILHQRREIVGAVSANQVVMVSGDTGCGKTTQVRTSPIFPIFNLYLSAAADVHRYFLSSYLSGVADVH